MLARDTSTAPWDVLIAGQFRSRSNQPPLPPAIMDHLGQKLRAAYYERSDKPKYLGDPALPLEFDPYLYRLEQKERAMRIERVGQQGLTAVADALSNLRLELPS
jgi:hypothetical protein